MTDNGTAPQLTYLRNRLHWQLCGSRLQPLRLALLLAKVTEAEPSDQLETTADSL